DALVAILGDVMTVSGHLRHAKIMHDIPSYHTQPVEAARIANEAHAKLLVFTHINPPLRIPVIAERAFLAGVSDVRKDGWLLGHDGLLIRLPGHSDAIEKVDLNWRDLIRAPVALPAPAPEPAASQEFPGEEIARSRHARLRAGWRQAKGSSQ